MLRINCRTIDETPNIKFLVGYTNEKLNGKYLLYIGVVLGVGALQVELEFV